MHDHTILERQPTVKISAMIRLSPGTEPHTQLLPRMADYARRIEASGFPGIWVGDSLGRGRPTLDPLTALAALATATERVELGISVIQVPLRTRSSSPTACSRSRPYREAAYASASAADRRKRISSCLATITANVSAP
jgi:hypothetical protein